MQPALLRPAAMSDIALASGVRVHKTRRLEKQGRGARFPRQRDRSRGAPGPAASAPAAAEKSGDLAC